MSRVHFSLSRLFSDEIDEIDEIDQIDILDALDQTDQTDEIDETDETDPLDILSSIFYMIVAMPCKTLKEVFIEARLQSPCN